ncbi:tetratricopeptide repeat protein [Luteimonas granuli]|uniref:Tetratricopeptide repeat protein n=1 Tax=Luteimonas granuli TaxID=1176533 RepID=A0A518N182_9GAMM|nr:tetratricopeptide repeat protein [Luteimonas granuli]
MHDPSLADLHAAERLLGSGDVAAALRLAAAALAGSAPHPAWHRLQGLALVASGRAVDARPHLQRYVALQPGEPEAWINLGNACIEAGDAKEALRAFEGAREAGASGVPYLLGRGLALLAAGCFGEALDWLRRARAEEPDAADVRLALGQCFAELERFDELRECIAGIDPETLPHGQRRAFAWLTALSGQDEAALALYRRLVLEEPAEPETRVRFALLLERMNRVQDAADLLGAGGTKAGSMEVLARARIARRQHHPATVADALAAAAAGEPDPAMAAQLWFELAKCRDQLHDPHAAMQALSRAHGHAAAAFRQRHPGLEAEQVLAWLGERLHGALPPPHPPLASDPPTPSSWSASHVRERPCWSRCWTATRRCRCSTSGPQWSTSSPGCTRCRDGAATISTAAWPAWMPRSATSCARTTGRRCPATCDRPAGWWTSTRCT